MTVYGEFLFLENALTGAVILVLTDRICGLPAGSGKYLRITAGSIMCGVYAFILFADIHWFPALISKTVFSFAVTAVSFSVGTVRMLLKRTALFYIISFLMGGITIAVMYITGMPGMAANGSIYMYGIKYMQILAGVLVTLAAGLWLEGYIKGRRHMEAVIMEAVLHAGAVSMKVTALVDTGNSLKDPVSGFPAAVMSQTAGKILLDELGETAAERFCLIPFRTVSGNGMMQGLRPDHITAGGERIEKTVLAFAECDFEPWKGAVKYDMLLHRQIFEGRI